MNDEFVRTHLEDESKKIIARVNEVWERFPCTGADCNFLKFCALFTDEERKAIITFLSYFIHLPNSDGVKDELADILGHFLEYERELSESEKVLDSDLIG